MNGIPGEARSSSTPGPGGTAPWKVPSAPTKPTYRPCGPPGACRRKSPTSEPAVAAFPASGRYHTWPAMRSPGPWQPWLCVASIGRPVPRSTARPETTTPRARATSAVNSPAAGTPSCSRNDPRSGAALRGPHDNAQAARAAGAGDPVVSEVIGPGGAPGAVGPDGDPGPRDRPPGRRLAHDPVDGRHQVSLDVERRAVDLDARLAARGRVLGRGRSRRFGHTGPAGADRLGHRDGVVAVQDRPARAGPSPGRSRQRLAWRSRPTPRSVNRPSAPVVAVGRAIAASKWFGQTRGWVRW